MLTFRKSLNLLPLIFLLLVIQFQAKFVSACSMDITGIRISQYDNKSCPDADYDDSVRLNVPVSDLVFELDIDPPEEKFTTYNKIFQLRATAILSNFSHTNYFHTGSKIHLITQRLRI